MQKIVLASSLGLFFGVCLTATAFAWTGSDEDPLSKLGFRASEGAAANYTPDRACGVCHAEKYKSYQQVGMAKSLAHPKDLNVIEAFGREFFHAPSQRYYQISQDGETLIFRRHQRDADGKPINEFETVIDWVMGSGNRARSYLYQTEWGELYMLPLGWYSEQKTWGMSPGFENADHLGLLRPVTRECMFCHNAFAETPSGGDLHWQKDRFPKDLPRGTGCQRCHGPGAEHIRAALTGSPVETIRAGIVNPRKLSPERRDSVCFQCHMLPAVTVVGARRFDRGDYSFRPGERLSDYLVHVDIDDLNIPRTERFEINHHGYRFWQSPCYQKSDGALACISCHDPHVKPASQNFRAHVSEVCLGCHEDQTTRHTPDISTDKDCVGCHMPTRRTRDVTLVTMTDHRIARGPFDAKEMVKPLVKTDPIITGLDLLPFGHPPTGDEGEIYRIASVLRVRPKADAAQAMKALLLRSKPTNPVPYLDLIEAQLKLRQYAEAEKTAEFILQTKPDLVQAHTRLGLARLGLGQNEAAMAALEKSLEIQPTPDAHYNLALVAFNEGRYGMALKQLEAAIAMRPNLYSAWMYKGRISAKLGRLAVAREALVRSLQIEPGNTAAYADLVPLLRRMGDAQAADRYLAVGLRVSREPGLLESLKRPKESQQDEKQTGEKDGPKPE